MTCVGMRLRSGHTKRRLHADSYREWHVRRDAFYRDVCAYSQATPAGAYMPTIGVGT